MVYLFCQYDLLLDVREIQWETYISFEIYFVCHTRKKTMSLPSFEIISGVIIKRKQY